MNREDIEYSIADIENQLIFIHSQMSENLEKIAELRADLKNYLKEIDEK